MLDVGIWIIKLDKDKSWFESPDASGPNIIPILEFLYFVKSFIKFTIEICFLLTSLFRAVVAKIKSNFSTASSTLL